MSGFNMKKIANLFDIYVVFLTYINKFLFTKHFKDRTEILLSQNKDYLAVLSKDRLKKRRKHVYNIHITLISLS